MTLPNPSPKKSSSSMVLPVALAVVGLVVVVVVFGGGFVVYSYLSPVSSAAPSVSAASVDASMVAVPGGTFQLGAQDAEADAKPVTVTIQGFELDTHEVTVAEYQKCVASKACEPARQIHELCNAAREDVGNHPINCVAFNQAATYCKWVNKRLPTEPEWEYAARGTDGRSYPWGERGPGSLACFDRMADKKGTCPIDSHPEDKSPFGVFNLGGNVNEWTQSLYCAYDGSQCQAGKYVVRGGSWDLDNPMFAKSTYRDFVVEEGNGFNLGFRCARGPVNPGPGQK